MTPLRPVGAIVRGLRVDTLDAGDAARLRRLLAEHGVLHLPAQHVDDVEFVGFLGSFGTLTFTTGETPVPGFPDLNVISNVERSRPPRSSFHVDTSYVRRPPAYTAPRVVQAPLRGGDTLFTNQYTAYDSLPPRLRAAIEDRVVTHVATGVTLREGQERSAQHPLALRHPVSGRLALFLSTAERCRAVSGLDDHHAAALIGDLLAHSTRQDNILRHRWAAGDVVVWDNRCVMHRADHHEGDADRILHRGTVHDGD